VFSKRLEIVNYRATSKDLFVLFSELSRKPTAPKAESYIFLTHNFFQTSVLLCSSSDKLTWIKTVEKLRLQLVSFSLIIL
jgi:hypothetical protein